MARGQTGSEYLVLVGSVIMIGVLMFLILRGQLLPQAANKVQTGATKYLDEYGKPYLFYDSFDTADASKWNVRSGTWSMGSGTFTQSSTAAGRRLATTGDFSWQQYAVQADFKLNSGSFGGVVARYNSSGGYYFCFLGGPPSNWLYFAFCTSVNCAFYGLTGTTFNPTTSYQTLKIVANGSSFNCSVNNQKSISITSNTISLYGEAGVATYTASASFDNFKVTKLPDLKCLISSTMPTCPP